MAVVFEGFSIREYTAKMRSIDVSKCWPFGGAHDDDLERKQLDHLTASYLLPVTVKKFRWWSDELSLVNSSEKRGDEQAKEDSRRNKSRAPKKRSIVDIFAVSPQIHKLHDEGISGAKKSNKKKKKHKKLSDLKKLIKKKKLSEEKTSKLRLQASINFARQTNETSCSSKRFVKDMVHALPRKPSLKCSSARKKNKFINTSKYSTVNQEKVSPPGILKDQKKFISGQKAKCRQGSSCEVLQPVKHVSFCDNNDTLGLQRKSISSTTKTIRNLDSSDCFSPSKENQFTGNDVESDARETSVDDDASVRVEIGTQLPLMIEKQPQSENCDFHYSAKVLRPNLKEQMLEKQFSEQVRPLSGQVRMSIGNTHLFDQAKQTAFCGASAAQVPNTHPGNLTLSFELKEMCTPGISQMCAGVSTGSTHPPEFIDYFEHHSLDVGEIVSSKENTRMSITPTSSNFTSDKMLNQSYPFPFQIAANKVAAHSSYRPCLPHVFPIEEEGTKYPFPELKERTFPFKEKYAHHKYIGLPLNSDGELVQESSCDPLMRNSRLMHSSGMNQSFVLSQGFDDRSSMKQKFSLETAVKKDQLNLFSKERYLDKNIGPGTERCLGVPKLLFVGNQNASCLTSDRNAYSSSFHPSLNHIDIPSHRFSQFEELNKTANGIVQSQENADQMIPNMPPPTMRLMGKDVPISRNVDEIPEYAAQKLWTGKEISRDHCTGSPTIQTPFFGRQLLAPASNKNYGFQGNLAKRPIESIFFEPLAKYWQTGIECGNVSHVNQTINRTNHFAHLPTAQHLFFGEANFDVPSMVGARTPRLSPHLAPQPTPNRTCQNMNMSLAELQSRQNLPNVGKSSFSFPFLPPDQADRQGQPSWFGTPSESLIPWLLHTTKQVKAPLIPSQPLTDVGYQYHLQSTHCSNSFFQMQPSHTIPHAHVSQVQMENPIGPKSAIHSPLVQYVPGMKLAAPMYQSHMKAMGARGGAQEPQIHGKIKKRTAGVRESCPTRPTKLPNLRMDQDDSLSKKVQVSDDDDANLVESVCNEDENDDNWKQQNMNDLLGEEGVVRSGPVKLSAGAKHILKPSDSRAGHGTSSSRLVHSTIPFGSVAEGGIFPEPRRNSST